MWNEVAEWTIIRCREAEMFSILVMNWLRNNSPSKEDFDWPGLQAMIK